MKHVNCVRCSLPKTLSRVRRILLLPALGLALFAALYGYGASRDSRPRGEVQRLAELLGVTSGSVAAELGSGQGRMTVSMAKIVGPEGLIYSTEIDKEMLAALKATVGAGLSNVSVVQAEVDRTALPSGCCDAIFMRKVYHHFTHPAELTASLFESVKPGGRVAVIDFEPRWWRIWLSRPKGVPQNRGGHGMPVNVLIDEMQTAGFEVASRDLDWWTFPERRYCLVFRKPDAEFQRTSRVSAQPLAAQEGSTTHPLLSAVCKALTKSGRQNPGENSRFRVSTLRIGVAHYALDTTLWYRMPWSTGHRKFCERAHFFLD